MLSTSDVAALFGVSPHTVAQWAKDGQLPSVRTLGGHRRYPAEEIARLVRQGTQRRRDSGS